MHIYIYVYICMYTYIHICIYMYRRLALATLQGAFGYRHYKPFFIFVPSLMLSFIAWAGITMDEEEEWEDPWPHQMTLNLHDDPAVVLDDTDVSLQITGVSYRGIRGELDRMLCGLEAVNPSGRLVLQRGPVRGRIRLPNIRSILLLDGGDYVLPGGSQIESIGSWAGTSSCIYVEGTCHSITHIANSPLRMRVVGGSLPNLESFTGHSITSETPRIESVNAKFWTFQRHHVRLRYVVVSRLFQWDGPPGRGVFPRLQSLELPCACRLGWTRRRYRQQVCCFYNRPPGCANLHIRVYNCGQAACRGSDAAFVGS
jgi:hypothetical protein